MTRARDELHLLAPVRFYVTQQSPQGDRYVHGARSRFMTAEVLATLEQGSWPEAPAGGPATDGLVAGGPSIDLAARLRALW